MFMLTKSWRNGLVAACLAIASLTAAACSDDNENGMPDARVTGTPDAPTATPDAPAAPTFAATVIDLIENQTADNTPAVAVDFTSADTEDPAAFVSLF